MRIMIDRSVVGTAEVIHDDGETRRFMESVSTLDSRDSVIENTCDMFGVMYNLGIFFVEISDDVECAMNRLVGAMEYIRGLSTTVEKIKRLENKIVCTSWMYMTRQYTKRVQLNTYDSLVIRQDFTMWNRPARLLGMLNSRMRGLDEGG